MNKRRWFLLILGVVAALLFALSACVVPTPEVIVEEVVETAVVEKEVPVEEEEVTIVYASPALGVSMDPCFMPGAITAEVLQHFYMPWTRYDQVPCPGNPDLLCDDTGGGDLTMLPGVFDSWELSEDGTVYTMHITEGIVDSYGNEFKAEDARWVFDRMRGTEASSVYIVEALNLKDPDQVKVVDDYTLEFHLPAPNPTFLRVLNVNNGWPYGAATVRQHATDDDPWAAEWMKRNVAAIGPYVLEDWTPGVEQVLVKNPDYIGPEPEVDRIIYRQVPESANRVAMLLSGEADIARDLNEDELEQLRQAPNVNVICHTGNEYMFLLLNFEMEPTGNPKVREALAYATPYEEIQGLWRGFAKNWYGQVGDMYSSFLGEDAYPYYTDYDKAKALLTEAGYPDGFDLPLFISAEAHPMHERVAVLLKEHFAKIGVNVTIENRPTAAFFDTVFNRQAPAHIFQDHSFVMDPVYHAFLFQSDQPAPNFNTSGFSDPEFHEMMHKGVAMVDGPERTEILHQMQERFYEVTGNVPLANLPSCMAFSDRVSGWRWHTHNQVMFDELTVSR